MEMSDIVSFLEMVYQGNYFNFFSINNFLILLIFPLVFDIGRASLKMLILVLLQLKNKFRKDNFSPTKTMPKLSIVIPAHNEEQYIQDAIESVLVCPYSNREIMIVDDGSTDNTQKIIKKYANKGLVKLIRHSKASGSKPAALNPAFAHATGDIIVIIDADSVLDKNALDNIPKYFEDESVIAAAGHVKIKSGDNGIENVLTRLQRCEYTQSIELGKKFSTIFNTMMGMSGAFLIIRRDAFEKVGRFNDDVRVEDFDITLKLRKLGKKIVFAEDAIVYTYCPNNLKSLVKQRLYWSEGEIEAVLKHKNIIKDSRYLLRNRFSFMEFLFTDIILGYASLVYFPILALTMFYEIRPELVVLFSLYLVSFVVTLFYNGSKSKSVGSYLCFLPLMLFFYGPFTRITRLVGFTKMLVKVLQNKISSKWKIRERKSRKLKTYSKLIEKI